MKIWASTKQYSAELVRLRLELQNLKLEVLSKNRLDPERLTDDEIVEARILGLL